MAKPWLEDVDVCGPFASGEPRELPSLKKPSEQCPLLTASEGRLEGLTLNTECRSFPLLTEAPLMDLQGCISPKWTLLSSCDAGCCADVGIRGVGKGL